MIMPLVYKCACCGRITEKPLSAEPYKKGYACQECFVGVVRQAKNSQRERAKRKYANH